MPQWKAALRFTSICLAMFSAPVFFFQSNTDKKPEKYIRPRFLMTIPSLKAFLSEKSIVCQTQWIIEAFCWVSYTHVWPKPHHQNLFHKIQFIAAIAVISDLYVQTKRKGWFCFVLAFFVLFVCLFKQRNIWLQTLLKYQFVPLLIPTCSSYLCTDNVLVYNFCHYWFITVIL